MNILDLPNDFLINTKSSIQVYVYSISKDSLKSKISLNTNVFSFLIEGSKELINLNHFARLNNEQFVIIPSGNCLMSEKLSSNQSYESVLLFFANDDLINFFNKNKFVLNNSEFSKPFLIYKYDNYIRNFAKSLKQIGQDSELFKTSLLQIKFEEIMMYLVYKFGQDFLHNFIKNEGSKVLHFKKIIEKNALNNLNIQEISFLCNMSVSTFKREFKKYYNESPKKWFQKNRLLHAAFLLRSNEKRPTDLYEEIGFLSLSSFTQAFKIQFGLTPKQFQLLKKNF